MEKIMSKTTQTILAAIVVVAGTSSAFAAPYHSYHHRMHYGASVRDPWFKPVHLDNPDVPAKTYFEQMQHDGR
jgi:hypothetical protein